MDHRRLLGDLQYFAASGVVLSTEQRVALQASLVVLKNAEKFHGVELWGIIQAGSKDYFIAQGLQGSDPVGSPRKSFVSLDGVTWAQLPEVHPVLAASALRIRTRFTGNLSHEYSVVEPGPTPDQPHQRLPEDVESLRKQETKEDGSTQVTTTVAEDKRISATVAAISGDTFIAPKGAIRALPPGAGGSKAETVKGFTGLTAADAGRAASYTHLRLPRAGKKASTAADAALDFLDPITQDVPSNSWSLQYQQGDAVAVVRSLLWPGHVHVTLPETQTYANLYVGIGTRNNSLAFMLP